jgi:hypothetical protein
MTMPDKILENSEDNNNTQDVVLDDDQQGLENTDVENGATTQTDEENDRDVEAAAMAKELGIEDEEIEEELNPAKAIRSLTPEQEKAAAEAAKKFLVQADGAKFAVTKSLNSLEKMLQKHGHEDFSLDQEKKDEGIESLSPMLQKYAPQAIDLLGQYKGEFMAMLFVGSLSYSSVKQLKALKANDARLAQQANDDSVVDSVTSDEAVAEAA